MQIQTGVWLRNYKGFICSLQSKNHQLNVFFISPKYKDERSEIDEQNSKDSEESECIVLDSDHVELFLHSIMRLKPYKTLKVMG